MPVGDQYSGPAAVVEVEELNAPTQQPCDFGEAGDLRHVIEKIITTVQIEGGGIVAEICFDDVLKARMGKVVRRYSHAALQSAVFVVGYPRGLGHLRESSVMIVVVEKAGGRIAGHVDVRPAIVVKICRHRCESVTTGRFCDSGFLRDVGERPVAVVVVERVYRFLQAAGTPHPILALPLALLS